jgi:GNAT superfamily N-acetyltransferase
MTQPAPVFSTRRATAADAGGILRYLRAAFEPYRDRYSPQAFDDTVLTPGTVHHRLASMAVFVAITPAGEIVGTIGCNVVNPEEGHIRGMAVLPGRQGTGVAVQLLQAAEGELRYIVAASPSILPSLSSARCASTRGMAIVVPAQ